MSTPVLELPPAFDYLVVRGLIAVLEGEGVVEYREGVAFPATFPGVAAVLGSRPASPDRLASFTPYAVPGARSGESMERVGVQVWLRYAGTNPRAVWSLADTVRDALDGLEALTLSTGVSMSLCTRASGTSLGQDSSSRWTWVENFYADVNHPTPNRY